MYVFDVHKCCLFKILNRVSITNMSIYCYIATSEVRVSDYFPDEKHTCCIVKDRFGKGKL